MDFDWSDVNEGVSTFEMELQDKVGLSHNYILRPLDEDRALLFCATEALSQGTLAV